MQNHDKSMTSTSRPSTRRPIDAVDVDAMASTQSPSTPRPSMWRSCLKYYLPLSSAIRMPAQFILKKRKKINIKDPTVKNALTLRCLVSQNELRRKNWNWRLCFALLSCQKDTDYNFGFKIWSMLCQTLRSYISRTNCLTKVFFK